MERDDGIRRVVHVALEEDAFGRLVNLSNRERRRPAEQAAYLLRKQLRRYPPAETEPTPAGPAERGA